MNLLLAAGCSSGELLTLQIGLTFCFGLVLLKNVNRMMRQFPTVPRTSLMVTKILQGWFVVDVIRKAVEAIAPRLYLLLLSLTFENFQGKRLEGFL